MKIRILPLVLALALVALSCGDDDPGKPGDAEAIISATLLLGGPGGSAATAGDTLVSTVRVTNNGDAPADSVVIFHPFIRNLVLVESVFTAAALDEPAAIFSPVFTLDAGKTSVMTVRFLIPEFYPHGWEVEAQAMVSYLREEDGGSVHATVPTGNPLTEFKDDPTRVAIRNDGVPLTLVGPGLDEVNLAGSFNNWSAADPDYVMFLDDAGKTWGLTIPIQGRHEYKFVIRRGTRQEWIGDPRGTRVVWDSYTELNSVVGVPLPDPVDPLPGGIDPAKLVIYELFVDDFSGGGRYRDVIQGLDGGLQDLADLGVNAIELLPVTAIPGGFNWGYTPWFYFSVENTYGSPEEFAELVEKAHDLDMAVILDMVFNHVGRGSVLEKLDDLGTPGTYINGSQDEVFGMRQTNWFSQDMRQFFLDAALFWIEQYGIDGFRMDLVDPADYDGYRWWRDRIKEKHPDFFLIGEDFGYPPNNSVTYAGFDAQWGGQHTDQWGGISNNFQNTVMALLKEGTYTGRAWWPPRGAFETVYNPMWALANVVSWTDGYPLWTNSVKYIVSHDERRVVDEVDRDGSDGAKAIGGIAKAKLGAATLFTAAGVPMFYMGEEIGENDFTPDHPAPNKVEWALGNAGVRAVYRNLIRLRLSHPSLAAGGTEFKGPQWGESLGPCQELKIVNYWRHAGTDPAQADFVVAANYDHDDHPFDVQFPSSGTWHRYDYENGTTAVMTVTGGVRRTTIPASTALIYVKNTDHLP